MRGIARITLDVKKQSNYRMSFGTQILNFMANDKSTNHVLNGNNESSLEVEMHFMAYDIAGQLDTISFPMLERLAALISAPV